MYKKTVFNNGVRVVTENIPGVRSVVVGLWIATGSRYEEESQAGISHFIEHLLFKGTNKRSAKEITAAIESVGGQLNAFTSKEYTCFYVRVLDEQLPLAIDVLSDMFFSSRFQPEEIVKEKRVVVEEIQMYEDSPDEIIHDLFSQTIWGGHPLGLPVIGNQEALQKINREDILEYYKSNYCSPFIAIAAVGNVDHRQVVSLLEPVFTQVSQGAPHQMVNLPNSQPGMRIFPKNLEQVHVCLGFPGIERYNEQIYPLQILNNVLGGDAGSRLFQKIREENGLAYNIYSYYTAFQDTGLISVYAGTSPASLQEVLDLITKELVDITREGITEEELDQTKEQLKGSLYLALESVTTRMHRLGKNEIFYNRMITPEEIVAQINKVKRDDLIDLARTFFQPSRCTITLLGDLQEKDFAFSWIS